MSDDQFTKLFKHMNKRFDEAKQEREQMREEHQAMQSSVDTYAKKADTYFQEMAALGNKLDRLEKALQEVIEATGVKVTL